MLQVTPQIQYRAREYPTNEMLAGQPELLTALPWRWHNNALVKTALSFALISGLAGCARLSSDKIREEVTEHPISIPVFEHGRGMGSYGCSSIAPPVFLSEEEARQVIIREATRHGIDFSSQKTLSDIDIPSKNLSTNIFDEDALRIFEYRIGALELDGYDKALDIGFEFISKYDVEAWDVVIGGGSLLVYDMLGTAKGLSEKRKKT